LLATNVVFPISREEIEESLGATGEGVEVVDVRVRVRVVVLRDVVTRVVEMGWRVDEIWAVVDAGGGAGGRSGTNGT
jgi:hypothetical protein